MEDRKTRINQRWLLFYYFCSLTENIEREPDFIDYLIYINWMILKICADLICQHIKLYKKNPMKNSILRIRMMTIKEYAKTGRRTDWRIFY